jgi:hypothetical protein
MDERVAWLARVRHDLCKRLLWPARDRRDLGGPVQSGELQVALTDDEGQPVKAADLWEILRASAPPGAPAAALDAFGAAVGAVAAAAARDDIAGVLALETAFEALARNVK